MIRYIHSFFFILASLSLFSQTEADTAEVNTIIRSYQNFINNKSNNVDFLKSKSIRARKPYKDTTDEAYFSLAALRSLYKNDYPAYEVVFNEAKIKTSSIEIDTIVNTYYSEVIIPQMIRYYDLIESISTEEVTDTTWTDDTTFTLTNKLDTIIHIDSTKKSTRGYLKLYITMEYKFKKFSNYKLEAITFDKAPYKHLPLSNLQEYWVSLGSKWQQVIKNQLYNFPDVPNDYFLKRISGIKELDLRKSGITDFEPLKGFSGLETLYLTDLELDTLSYLENCTNLTGLFIAGCSLTSLHGLEKMTKLISLNAARNEISDLTPIKGCTEMSYLNLNENEITDLTPIKGLTSLKTLKFNLNKVENMDALSNMPVLSELHMRKNKEIPSLEPIRACGTLYKLDCFNTSIDDLDPIRNHTRLVHLDCSHTKISSLEPLKNLTNLVHLAFAANSLSDFSVLSKLDKLRFLNCSQTNISDITPLNNMDDIEELNAAHTDFTKQDIQRFKKKHPGVSILFY